MNTPENNQHLKVLILVGGDLRISMLCTIKKMLTIVNGPNLICSVDNNMGSSKGVQRYCIYMCGQMLYR